MNYATPFVTSDIANKELIEDLYEQFQKNPSQLDPSWKGYFDSLESQVPLSAKESGQDGRVLSLIEAYRFHGHLLAKTDPITLQQPEEPRVLDPKTYGFQSRDLSQSFDTYGMLPEKRAPLSTLIEKLRSLYSASIGFEFKGTTEVELEKWIQNTIETGAFRKELSVSQKKLILEFLTKAELFDSFLHMKYVGQKRFSLEGAETFIPMLGFLMEEGADKGLQEIVLGMTHRGRLNVMTSLLNKSYKEMFLEFDEEHIPRFFEGTGDVKYHKGHSADNVITKKEKRIKVTLTPNPSHLESVDAVVEGQTRAKQIQSGDTQNSKIIPILVHGDAALSGQGVVYETLQFYKLRGYSTGGTIHFVLNNQIGFTTIPRDARSTTNCTDIAKTFGAPVFHVNAEDPESCVLASLVAWEIRQKFHCDVFVELNCYRKYGHNETDEPAFTQPLEYQIIRKKKPVHELYKEMLIEQGVINKSDADSLENHFNQELQKVYSEVMSKAKEGKQPLSEKTEEVKKSGLSNPVETGVPENIIKEVAAQFSRVPEDFNLHPKVQNLLKERLEMANGNKPVDWGMGEYLAYASLLWEGIPVRISGQDCCRGTFSHRHAIWVDQSKEKDYFPLAHLKEEQGRFEIYNSSLSEYAVLGFEYGYSTACYPGLTIWEAQFGDFANGAQVVIDQYIVSGEQKWGQLSGLTLFLPHGYEGHGPEHSSGRMERFLTLTGHDNIQVTNPSTPAQFFHLLRRQVKGPLRKPLIVFTPKGLLRLPACTNPLSDFTRGSFQEILDDPMSPIKATQLILCTGHLYYSLIEQRQKAKREDIAMIRIEQLYPFNEGLLLKIINQYANITECLWVQEEHENMGAWTFIQPHLTRLLPKTIPLKYVGRGRSASPATGSHKRHEEEHQKILNQVFSNEIRN